MVGDGTDEATREAASKLAESRRDILELRSRREPGILLLRPDGYVAFSTHHDGAASLDKVCSLLESVEESR